MKSAVVCSTLLVILLSQGLAFAQPVGEKPKPGDEIKAIAPVFGMGGTWTGKVPEGAMGPSSPATTTQGKANCHSAVDGFCYVCDVQDKMGSGKDAMLWKGHIIIGYDMPSSKYQAYMSDNTGALTAFDGTLDGKKFSLETPNEVMMMGQSMKDRLTWDFTDENAVKFTDEHLVSGGSWTTFETAVMKPMKPTTAAPKPTTTSSR